MDPLIPQTGPSSTVHSKAPDPFDFHSTAWSFDLSKNPGLVSPARVLYIQRHAWILHLLVLLMSIWLRWPQKQVHSEAGSFLQMWTLSVGTKSYYYLRLLHKLI
jgi:hypothetical protein